MVRLLAVAFASALVSACGIQGSARPVVLDPTPRAPTSPSAVQAFASAPDRPHQVIATWRVAETSPYGSQANVLRQRALRHAAAAGADAVILTVREGTGMAVDATSPAGVDFSAHETRIHAQFIVWR